MMIVAIKMMTMETAENRTMVATFEADEEENDNIYNKKICDKSLIFKNPILKTNGKCTFTTNLKKI